MTEANRLTETFGEQWRVEMMKWRKSDLIDALGKAWRENRQHKESINFLTHNPGAVAFEMMKAEGKELQRVETEVEKVLTDVFAAGTFQSKKREWITRILSIFNFNSLTTELKQDLLYGKPYPINEEHSREYLAGFDAGYNTPTTENSHYSYFATPKQTKEWERGKLAGALNRKDEGPKHVNR